MPRTTPRPRRPAPAADPAAQQALQRAARLTGVVGIGFAALFVVSLFSFSQAPREHATDAEIMAFYQSSTHEIMRLGSLYLLPLAAIAFLWFVASLHAWVELSGRPIDRLMSTVQMLGGVSFVTLSLAAAAAATVASFSTDLQIESADLLRQFPLFGRTLLMVFGMRMAALFVMSTAQLVRSGGLMPAWFFGLSLVVAVVLFASSSLNVWLTLLFPLWIIVLCVVIWATRATHAVSHAS